MSKFNKLYSFLNRIVTIKPVEYDNEIIKYDTDNKFPQNLILQLSESGTATSCIDALNQYCYADGLVDENLGKELANEKQTYNEVVDDLLQQYNTFGGNALHVMRDSSGNIISRKAIPFENIRKTKTHLIYNTTYSSGSYDSSKDCKHPYFKGEKITSEELAEITQYKNKYGETVGEILYYFKPKPGQYIYPIPSYFAAISDINTDAEHSKYELESVNNSFLPSGILTLVGEVDDVEKDEHGNTEQDNISQLLEGFTGNVKDRKGESGRNKLLVLNAKNKEEIANYQPISNEGILTAIDIATTRIANKVARAFGVPPFIIGLGGNVGFATNIIADNITLFNNRISRTQKIALIPLKMCDSSNDYSMTQLNPVKYIQPEVLAKLTDAELRELGGYKPLENASIQTTNN